MPQITRFKIRQNPLWISETVTCIRKISRNLEDKLENPIRFGMTQEEADEFLKPLINYEQAVVEEVRPVLIKYPNVCNYTVDFSSQQVDLLIS